MRSISRSVSREKKAKDEAPGSEGRSRFRTILLVPVAAFLIYLLAGGALFISVSRSTPTYGAATVPDTLLLSTPGRTQESLSPGASPISKVSAYLPGAKKPRAVLKHAGDPTISPDGQRLIFEQTERVKNESRSSVVALDVGSLKRLWATRIKPSMPSTKLNYSNEPQWTQTAVTSDRVYVATQAGSADLPVTIIALDRSSGKEVKRWTVGLEGKALVEARLIASPDGKKLYMVAATQSANGNPWLYFRFDLPGGKLERRHELSAPGPANTYPLPGFLHDAGVTPDGETLYSFYATGNASTPVIRFLDLKSGKYTPSLKLPLQYAQGRTVSSDGRLLYVLDSTSAKLAVVDLNNRRLKKVVKLDISAVSSRAEQLLGKLDSFFIQPAAAKTLASTSMQLSPNGRRLYAIGVEGGAFGGARSGGVWVIDTSTWRVTNRWLAGSVSPTKLVLSGDGKRLYVQGISSSGTNKGFLRMINTKTGARISAMKTTPYTEIFSPQSLYREAYGKSPR